MYEPYWQLDRKPFSDDADPQLFFRSPAHQSALLKLRYLIEQEKGAGLLVGDIGCGKTFVARQLAAELPTEFSPVIHLVFPQLAPAEFLGYLAVELGADPVGIRSSESGLDHTLHQIQLQLQRFFSQKLRPVIVVDEAHLIDDPRVLNTLKLLLNFRQRESIDFTLLLLGQPELLSRVKRMAELDDRIAVKAMLRPLSLQETHEYVMFRLQAAGRTRPVFEETAWDLLFELSGGIPRRINQLCDLALLVGFAENLESIDAAQIEAVAEELTGIYSE